MFTRLKLFWFWVTHPVELLAMLLFIVAITREEEEKEKAN